MTSLSAAKLGVTDRGLLRPGDYADVTVFDPEHIADKATYSDPFQYSTGVVYVVVNGKVVLDGGKHTGERPGRRCGMGGDGRGSPVMVGLERPR